MSDDHSVSILLDRLKAEDSLAAEKIWTRYMERLIRLASRKLGDLPKRAADEEDVVLSAYHGFLDGVKKGRFMRLDDRDDLWQILVMLTERKAIGLRRHEGAEKRGAGKHQGNGRGANEESVGGVSQAPDQEPTPEFAVELNEQMAAMLEALGDDTLRHVAVLKLEGFANREIADKLDIGERSVERKLGIIRRRLARIERWRCYYIADGGVGGSEAAQETLPLAKPWPFRRPLDGGSAGDLLPDHRRRRSRARRVDHLA